MTHKSIPIYKRDTAGKIRTWQVEVEGPAYRVIAGIQGGNLVTSKWKTAKPKNVGKKNETTPEQQAQLEALADHTAKLKREYRRTIPELEFVPNGPMLALGYDDLKEPLEFWKGVYSQPKLDGIRSMKNLKLGASTRELQPHLNCGHLMTALQPLFAKYPGIEFDGELYNHDHHDDFNAIARLVRKEKLNAEQKAKIESTLQFHVYDLPSDGDVFGGRTARLKDLIESLGHPMIVYVPTEKVKDQDHLDALNVQYVEYGYEGQMVRLDICSYEFDVRSKSLLKRKSFITEEFSLIEIGAGEGNWGDMAKWTTVQLPNGKTCETGMRGNQDFAKELLANKSKYTQATIRYFGYTPDGKLRFPVAIDFHENGRVD
jgi:DNA ligase-1